MNPEVFAAWRDDAMRQALDAEIQRVAQRLGGRHPTSAAWNKGRQMGRSNPEHADDERPWHAPAGEEYDRGVAYGTDEAEMERLQALRAPVADRLVATYSEDADGRIQNTTPSRAMRSLLLAQARLRVRGVPDDLAAVVRVSLAESLREVPQGDRDMLLEASGNGAVIGQRDSRDDRVLGRAIALAPPDVVLGVWGRVLLSTDQTGELLPYLLPRMRAAAEGFGLTAADVDSWGDRVRDRAHEATPAASERAENLERIRLEHGADAWNAARAAGRFYLATEDAEGARVDLHVLQSDNSHRLQENVSRPKRITTARSSATRRNRALWRSY